MIVNKISTKLLRFISSTDADALDRKVGSKGEIFFDSDLNSLRLFDGVTQGGVQITRSDLINVTTTQFRAKSVESRLATVVYTVTITGPQGADSGNKYNLNSVYRPVPNFVVGYTYVFVQDNQTNVYFPNATGTTPNPHPLNFSADNLSGERGGGTSYLTDVRYFLDGASVTQAVYNSTAFNTATSRQVWITVTNSTPSTLYYWCWNHTAMGNSIAVADPGSGSGSGSSGVSVSSTVPNSPSQGSLWLDTNTGRLYVYYNDGDSAQWVQPSTPFPDSAKFSLAVAADDSTQRPITSGNTIKFIGGGGVTTSSDADGNITITGGATTGDITFVGTTIDSSDSSPITLTPAIRIQSDLTIENDLIVNNLLTTTSLIVDDILLQGDISTQGSTTPEIVSDNEILLVAGTRVEITNSPLKMCSFTSAERDLLIAENGDMIYNTTTNKFQGRANGSWIDLH